MKESKSSVHKALEMLFELVGWVRIMLSPLLIGALLGAIVYTFIQNMAGLILAIILLFGGLIAGIALANRAWKKKGTIFFLSRVIATPELDNRENKDAF